jgi:adenylate kinase
MTNLVLFGPPGSGKGTQSKILQEKLGLTHISTGDLVRAEIASGSETGKHMSEIVAKGEYPADELILSLFEKAISKPAKGYIIDGVPRTLNQAKTIEVMFQKLQLDLTAVIEIVVDQEVLIKRLTGRFMCKNCQALYNDYFSPLKVEGVCDVCKGTDFVRRPDDDLKAVKRRFEVYNDQTRPLVDYYLEKGLLSKVDGMVAPNQVTTQILSLLQEKDKKVKKA